MYKKDQFTCTVFIIWCALLSENMVVYESSAYSAAHPLMYRGCSLLFQMDCESLPCSRALFCLSASFHVFFSCIYVIASGQTCNITP